MAFTTNPTQLLPLEILEKISSFLTTKEAVQNCLISKRWLAVWKRVPRLIFDQSEFYYGNDNEFEQNFQNFGDHVFEKFLLSTIDLFHIELVSFNSYHLVERWIPHIRKLNPKVLSFEATLVFSFYLGMLFDCPSVHELTVCIHDSPEQYFSFEFVQINLPHLRKLYLSFASFDKKTIGYIFNKCRFLEDLTLLNCHGDFSSVFNQRVISLCLFECTQSLIDVIPDVVSLPSIRKFSLRSCFVDDFSIQKIIKGSHLLQDVLFENYHGTFSTVIRNNLESVSLKRCVFATTEGRQDFWKVERATIRRNSFTLKSIIFVEATFHPNTEFDANLIGCVHNDDDSFLKIIGHSSMEYELDLSTFYSFSMLLSGVEVLEFYAPQEAIDVKEEFDKIGFFSNLKKLYCELTDWSMETSWAENPYERDIVRWFLINSPNVDDVTVFNPFGNVRKFKGARIPAEDYYRYLVEYITVHHKLKLTIKFSKDPFGKLKFDLRHGMGNSENVKLVISEEDV